MIGVYVHCKPDMTPFYIGKGSYKRAHSLCRRHRNKWHGNIVKKYGRDNIVIEFLACRTPVEANFRERLAIASLRAAGVDLCNILDGGDGGAGRVVPETERARLSLMRTGTHMSVTTKQKLSSATLMQMSHPGRRAISSAAATAQMASPELRERSLSGLRALHAAPDFAARMAAIHTGRRAITNGKETRRLFVDEQFTMPEGWRFGVHYSTKRREK